MRLTRRGERAVAALSFVLLLAGFGAAGRGLPSSDTGSLPHATSAP